MTNERTRTWASTMAGATGDGGLRVAHPGTTVGPGAWAGTTRERREAHEAASLAPGATRSAEAGHREVAEVPDHWRTCFERDRDRILHSTTFRRLAGKTQVFVFPADHQRTRLTHALEVAQVAVGISHAIGLNVALAEAIALGHDCGHGPGGHASEDALSPYIEGGYDHAVWGADVILRPLNLCVETLDGIRNHSWSRPAPRTPEGEVVAWADRIAYVCHDFEDAAATGVVSAASLPGEVLATLGAERSGQISRFITSIVDTALTTGRIGMAPGPADALAQFRQFNYENIYLRAESQDQAQAVIAVLRGLVDHYLSRPEHLPADQQQALEAHDPVHVVVTYVGGMTDRFACRQAISLLDWPLQRLPRGIDV